MRARQSLRTLALVLLSASAHLVLGSSQGLALQEDDDASFFRQGHEFIFELAPDGQLTILRKSTNEMVGVSQQLKFLANPNICAELELTDEQATKLQTACDEFSEVIDDCVQRLKEHGFDQPTQLDCARLLAEANSEFSEATSGLLLEHQLQRLSELEFRFALRRNGLFAALIHGQLGRDIGIDAVQKRELIEAATRAREFLKKETALLRKEHVDEVFAILDAEQRGKLNEQYESVVRFEEVGLGILMAQLATLQNTEKESESPDQQRWSELAQPNRYRLAPDGTFVALPPSPLTGILEHLSNIVLDPNVGESLGLTDEQVQAFEQFRAKREEIIAEFHEMQSQMIQIGGRDNDVLVKHRDKQLESLRDQVSASIDDILLPHQIKALERIVERIGVNRNGLVASLLRGNLANRLDVTSSLRRNLEDAAQEIQSELIQKTSELEDRAHDLLLRTLRPDQVQTIRGRIGASLKHTGANTDFLYIQLDEAFARSAR